jgi:hypothetical protein
MTYEGRVLALTRHFAKLSISPESSDGFASVGTILPKEEAALLPGGFFAFAMGLLKWMAQRGRWREGWKFFAWRPIEMVSGECVSPRRVEARYGRSFGDYRICRVACGTVFRCGQCRSG